MKCTCSKLKYCVGTQRNLYITSLRLGFALGKKQLLGFASGKKTKNIPTRGILALGDAEVLSFALGDAKVPEARYFAFWWNIGLRKLFSKLIDYNS